MPKLTSITAVVEKELNNSSIDFYLPRFDMHISFTAKKSDHELVKKFKQGIPFNGCQIEVIKGKPRISIPFPLTNLIMNSRHSCYIKMTMEGQRLVRKTHQKKACQ